MRKFITIIAVLSLLMAVPVSSAIAGSNHHNNNSSNSSNASANADASASATGGSAGANASATGGSASAIGGSSNATGGGASINDGSINVTVEGDEAPVQRDVTTSNINNRGSGFRGFANQAEIAYAPLPGYLGPARHDANVQSAKTIVMFKDTFTRADVKELTRDVSIDTERHVPVVDKKDRKDTDTVTVIFIAPDKSTVRQCAVITTKATDHDTTSVDVLGSAIYAALNVDADVLLITAEGLSTELRSFGWGIGLAYTNATISTDERSGGVASGGLGISGGKAGYKSFPWIQAIALKFK